jgi:hypothetical protein
MAQTFGLTGLLFVPIGAIWLIYEIMKRCRKQESGFRADVEYNFALVALVVSFVVTAGVAFSATQTGLSLGLIVLVSWGYLVWRSVPVLKRLKHDGVGDFNPAPLYLILVPGILVIFQLTLIKPAVEFSRKWGMMGSADLINAIEAYHAAHGHYPLSLASLHHDYDPPIVGIEQYHYEFSGRTYNVFFEHFTYRLGTREILMYNPLNEQAMVVHNRDLLESTQVEVNRERDFHARAAFDAGIPHWKYFWFD